ncbi:MAG: TrkA family potassium uptake protein [Phycisphaerales bacterium]|nr:TrkA family potassium uptake protein [Phycisphaerales bacterium]
MTIYSIHSDREDIGTLRSLRRRVYAAALALGLTVVISTIGLLVLGRHDGKPAGTRLLDAMWDTLNLVSTVGSLEEEFTTGQRIWAMVVIAIGLGAVLYGFGTLQTLIQEDFVRLYARRSMKRTIDDMQDHIIVCGYGQVGRSVGQDLAKSDIPVLVIDHVAEVADRADSAGFVTMHADCTDDATLKQAGITRARGLVAALDSDAANVYLILIARELNPTMRIVARAEREETSARIRRAGANSVIAPSDIAGFRLSNMLRKPNISEFMDAIIRGDEYEFAEVPVKSHRAFAGQTLRELNLTKIADALVISIVTGDGSHVFNPSADRTLADDDVLLVVARGEGLSRMQKVGRSA